MILSTILLAVSQFLTPADSLNTLPLGEVTVVARQQSARTIDSISAGDIARTNPATAADMLSATGGVSVQKSQLGGGSPMLRGFEASRILLTVDGVRMNNLIYRAGHLQNVISIDPSALDRAEILYGPASVGHGSDALGGVIAFHTKSPTLATHSGSTYLRVNSNPAGTLHTDFNLGWDKFASFTAFTVNGFADLRSGKNRNPFLPDGDSYIHRPWYVNTSASSTGELTDHLEENRSQARQRGSGYTQYDVLQKFLYKPSALLSHTLNFQFSTTSDVDRYDRLTDRKGDGPKFAQWYYGPQQRLLASYNLGLPNFTAIVAYQNVKESRHNRKLGDKWLGHRCENVNVVSLTTEWGHSIDHRHSIHAGIDGALQFLSSKAYKEDITSGVTRPLDTRYPNGGNYMHNIDAYFAHSAVINRHWQFSDGVRVGYTQLQARFDDTEFFPLLTREYGTVTQRNPTYSLNAGATYHPDAQWRLGLAVSSAYRVPNIDDLAKVFDFQPGIVVVPNPKLNPEKTLGVDFNIAHFSQGLLQFEASVFGTYLFDAIALAPTTVGGQSVIDYDGEPSDVFSNHNVRRAYVAGASANFACNLPKNFRATATATYTYGNYLRHGDYDRQPLDHVPPLFGRIGVGYDNTDSPFEAEIYTLFNGSKPLSRYNLNGEDNIGYATEKGADGKGLPAWFTLNIRAGYRFSKAFTLQASIENLLDTEYRTFGSGINAPGCNASITARITY